MRRGIAILGATGSIGRSAAKVIARNRDQFRIIGLASGSRAAELAAVGRELEAETLILSAPDRLEELQRLAPPHCQCSAGADAMEELCIRPDVDLVLCAIVGVGGLKPVLAALRCGKTVALASKEVMVCAGELVNRTAREHGGRILPVDSEHSALFQCLEHRDPATVRRLILTASGGAFRDRSAADMEHVTAAEALAHPVWSMGPKVTIDSASMMNKALELVEAHRLFGFGADRLDVLLHPQSVVHSLVEFRDGAQLALLSQPDMALPIQYALSWPERWNDATEALDLAQAGTLTFSRIDRKKYPAIDFAFRAIERGGTLAAAMNAANEVAVAEFCAGRIAFPRIWSIIEQVMADFPVAPQKDIETILAADALARKQAAKLANAE